VEYCRKMARVATLILVAAVAVFGQAFEVVSIKPTADLEREPIGLFTYAGGRIRATNYALRQLVQDAYDLEDFQVVGGPRWIDEDRFNVEAVPPASSASSKWAPANFKSPPNAEMRRMIQALLADRFQLKTHRENRAERVYVLVSAKGGHKLKAPKSTAVQAFVIYQGSRLSGQNATMDQLAARLAQLLRRPVMNRTGVDGHFDFLIDYQPDDAGSDYTARLLRAIQEQAGLKLETEPGTIEVLVVDSAQKPSAN
jgi:uncharacterized protein (TIGR03435 family)